MFNDNPKLKIGASVNKRDDNFLIYFVVPHTTDIGLFIALGVGWREVPRSMFYHENL